MLNSREGSSGPERALVWTGHLSIAMEASGYA